jgi:nitroreductase
MKTNQDNRDAPVSETQTVPGAESTEMYEQFMALVKKRRSSRRFKPDPIPEGYAERILEAARWTMSGANCQPWEFIVVRNPEKIKALYKAYQDHIHELNFWLEQRFPWELRHPGFRLEGDTQAQYRQLQSRVGWSVAPALIVVLGDGRRQLASVSAVTTPGRHQTHLTDALANAALTIHLAAASLGLTSEWVSIHIQEPFKQLLNVPPLLTLHSIIPLGYPEKSLVGSYRRKLQEFVHYETYDAAKMMSTEDVLKYLYKLREGTIRTYSRSRGENIPQAPGE